jgi:hypothetical protein
MSATSTPAGSILRRPASSSPRQSTDMTCRCSFARPSPMARFPSWS